MITTVAFYILLYSGGVLLLAAGLRLLGRRFRGLATRIAAVFGIFALAAAYVWVDLGPEIDHQLASHDQPLIVPQGPRQIEI